MEGQADIWSHKTISGAIRRSIVVDGQLARTRDVGHRNTKLLVSAGVVMNTYMPKSTSDGKQLGTDVYINRRMSLMPEAIRSSIETGSLI